MDEYWDAIMHSRTCLVQAIDQNVTTRAELQRATEEMQINHERLTTALARLDMLVGAPSGSAEGSGHATSHTVSSGDGW